MLHKMPKMLVTNWQDSHGQRERRLTLEADEAAAAAAATGTHSNSGSAHSPDVMTRGSQ